MKEMFFYLFLAQQATVLQIKSDSVYYFDGIQYIKKPILHENRNILLTDSHTIYWTNTKIQIIPLGKHKISEVRTYKVRKLKLKP